MEGSKHPRTEYNEDNLPDTKRPRVDPTTGTVTGGLASSDQEVPSPQNVVENADTCSTATLESLGSVSMCEDAESSATPPQVFLEPQPPCPPQTESQGSAADLSLPPNDQNIPTDHDNNDVPMTMVDPLDYQNFPKNIGGNEHQQLEACAGSYSSDSETEMKTSAIPVEGDCLAREDELKGDEGAVSTNEGGFSDSENSPEIDPKKRTNRKSLKA